MTDKEIGKVVRDIAERGLSAVVKKDKNGIIILEEKRKIIKREGGS